MWAPCRNLQRPLSGRIAKEDREKERGGRGAWGLLMSITMRVFQMYFLFLFLVI